MKTQAEDIEEWIRCPYCNEKEDVFIKVYGDGIVGGAAYVDMLIKCNSCREEDWWNIQHT